MSTEFIQSAYDSRYGTITGPANMNDETRADTLVKNDSGVKLIDNSSPKNDDCDVKSDCN